MTPLKRFSSILTASAMLVLASSSAVAQTANPIIVPKYLGEPHKFKKKDIPLTRDELRACMALNESNNKRSNELYAKIDENEKERLALDEAKGNKQTPPTDASKQLEREWKARYDALLKEEAKLDDSREDYFVDCAQKRFLKDDEIAIKAEK